MSNRRMTLVGLSLFACLWLAAQAIAPLAAQQNGTAREPEESQTRAKEQELDIRYAKAHLTMLEATLARYQDLNRNAPKTVRGTVTQSIEESVSDARERLKQAESGDVNASAIYVTKAETNLRLAEEMLRQSEAVNTRVSNAVSPAEIERLKAARDLAKVKVDKARHLALESPLSNVRYELEQLHEEVQDLRLLVALLQTKN